MSTEELLYAARSKKLKCRRHEWSRHEEYRIGHDGPFIEECCLRCGQPRDLAATKRGRNNRTRGQSIERWACKELGVTKVGHFGGADDGRGDYLVVSVKSGGYFTERVWNELQRLTANANQTSLLLVADTPGPGRKRRAYVVLTLEDWQALHGPAGEAA